MVDARDLKSLGPQGLYEFESRSRYKYGVSPHSSVGQ